MSSVATTTGHSAPGPLAGYLFQPERALYHLATQGRGSAVGIETADDVVVMTAEGNTIREQDKHYTTERPPLGDRSKELWNSLFIWQNSVDAGEVGLEQTEFHLVTNKAVQGGIAEELGAVILWAFTDEYCDQMRRQAGPPLVYLLPVLPMVMHEDTVNNIYRRHFDGGLLLALAEDRTLTLELQERMEAMTPQTMEALNLAFSAGLLTYLLRGTEDTSAVLSAESRASETRNPIGSR